MTILLSPECDPHPLLRKQRSLELGSRPPQHPPPRASKWTKVKRAFLTSASASVPSSPNRHSAFFTDAGKWSQFLMVTCNASLSSWEYISMPSKRYALIQNYVLSIALSKKSCRLSWGNNLTNYQLKSAKSHGVYTTWNEATLTNHDMALCCHN